MLLRIWTLLLAVLLFAAPADNAFAEVDAQSESVTACDELVIQVVVDLPPPTTAPVPIVKRDEPLPPAPARGRIFRPPRPAFD